LGVLVVSVFAAMSIFFLWRANRAGSASRRLARFASLEPEEAPGRAVRPGASLRSLLGVPCRLLPGRVTSRIGSDLVDRAGLSGYSREQLVGMRLCSAIFLPASLLLLMKLSAPAIVLAAPSCLVGAMLPRFVAARNREAYLDSVRAALPATTDMLYVFVLGGKNLDQAFRAAAGEAGEPLGPLLSKSIRRTDLGMPRAESFRLLAESCPVEELSSLLDALIEIERRGRPPAELLSHFSREIRLRQRDRLKVAVAKAPLKMLAPLVFLVLPASVILTVGPTFLSTLSRVF
jgi:tight adherence protein C